MGQHDGVCLLDKLHLATLGLIMGATAWGVPSPQVLTRGPHNAAQHRRDLIACGGFGGAYVPVNIVLVALAALGA